MGCWRKKDSAVTGRTRVCGIIGDPVEHTMSPVMHNAAFRELGLDYIYIPFKVKKEELDRAVDGMRGLNIRGLNVTIPHKVGVIPLLDGLDPLAEKIGAVNTIVNDGGVLTGYNTDAEGFLRALLEQGVEPGGKNVAILGAGGASRAISFILAGRGSRLAIINRRVERAKELARSIARTLSKEVESLELNEKNLSVVLARADILINATSAGMVPDIDKTPLSAWLLKPGLVVVDIVYNPVKTRLLREAEKAGARTIAGLDMLVWQGALAFEKWTGQKAPADVMREAAIEALGHED